MSVLPGAEVLLRDPIPETVLPHSARVGMITNQSGLLSDGRPSYEVLRAQYDLAAFFSPEHGMRGDVLAGDDVPDYIDEITGLPVYSTYGPGQEAAQKTMAKLDALFFDIQDIGSRYYTYQYTMAESMEVAAKAGIPFIVLDRPPMIGCVAEGNILNTAYASFVGKYATAARTGLTIGEFARYVNAVEGIGCKLTVIPCSGLDRSMYYDETGLAFLAPSSCIPTVDCALAYVGTCLLEGTNLSEGRGTPMPFTWFGAPWLRAEEALRTLPPVPGCTLSPLDMTPTSSKHKGTLCHGIALTVTDRASFAPFAMMVRLLAIIRRQNKEFAFSEFFLKLFGSNAMLADDFDEEAYLAALEAPLAAYREAIKPYYLY